jgi:hypothetical protein
MKRLLALWATDTFRQRPLSRASRQFIVSILKGSKGRFRLSDRPIGGYQA